MRIHSIFQSINGEVTSSFQGSLATFIRFQGCNLSCPWCDTPDTQNKEGGKEMSRKQIVHFIKNLPISTKNVTITGGEPLIQNCTALGNLLFDLSFYGKEVTIETNGTIPFPFLLYKHVKSIIMDIKPSSLPNEWMKAIPLIQLQNHWIKFPIQNSNHFWNAVGCQKLLEDKGFGKLNFAYSPILPMTPEELFYLIQKERIGKAVLNVQIHKLIGLA